MSAIRWAPLLMMVVADIPSPGGCCGGARYEGRARRNLAPVLSVTNHSTVDICTFEWMAGEGSQPQRLIGLYGSANPEPPLKAPASRQFMLPAAKFTLRLLDCQGKELLLDKDIVPNIGESVSIDYP